MVNTTVSHYKIEEELGRGGMGVVYRAVDTRLGRTVALKFLAEHLSVDDRARERFLQEARTAAALTHANIATLYDVVEHERQIFIAMEFVEGRSLAQILKSESIPFERIVDYMVQIACGLERAREANIVHRDIKPANLMVTNRHEVKILDFGLARLGAGAGISKTGAAMGTAAYMSPEQVRAGDVDHRTDLWALGVVFYEMITGRRPFHQEYEHAVYYSILNEKPKPISDTRPEIGALVDPIIDRLMAKEPRDRFASAGDVMEALRVLPVADSDLGSQLPTPPSTVTSAPSKTTSATATESTSERRQLTVVHAEPVNLQSVSDDPEDLRDFMYSYQALCEAEIRRFEGLPMRGVGGSVLGYFGYPQAHDDDPLRAVRCALRIRSEVGRMSGSPTVRIGVHTGLAVIGEESGEIQVFGQAGDVAAKIAAQSEPETISIGKLTHDLTKGYFDVKSTSDLAISGSQTAMKLYEIDDESGASTRLDAVAETELTPLVGRNLELDMLRARWRQVLEGRGCAVLVSGEAGIGKSRLLDSFQKEVGRSGDAWQINLVFSALNESSAFHPFVEYLQQYVISGGDGAPADPITDLEHLLEQSGIPHDPYLGVLADLLAVPLPAGVVRTPLAPAAQKQKTIEVLLTILSSRSDEEPGLIVFEDFHWSDPSTSELVDLLVSQLPAQPLLAVLTARPPTHPNWLTRAHATEITLNRLTREETIAISRYRSGGKSLPDEVLTAVAERTDGIPLFAEELTQMLLESGILIDAGDQYELSGPLPDSAIPETLQGSLMARLDRLAEAKVLAQIGSVIGRQFSFQLIQQVSDEGEAELTAGLSQLVDAELILQRGFAPLSTYTFKHALIQDAAYQSLLKGPRKTLHGKVAEMLEGTQAAQQPEAVAHHYSQAGNLEKAIPLWKQAGEQAMSKNSIAEAVRHLRSGLELVGKLPAGPERDLKELRFLNLLGPATMMATGYGNPESEQLFKRAQELCGVVKDVQLQVLSLQGLFLVYWIRSDYARALEIAQQSLEITEQLPDPALSVLPHSALAWTYLQTSQLEHCRAHCERVLELYDPKKHDPLGQLGWGLFDQVTECCLFFTLHMLGYPDRALALSEDVRQREKGSDNELSVYNRHLWTGILFLARREWQACQEIVAQYLPSALEFGDPFKIGLSSVVMNLGIRDPADVETFRSTRGILEKLDAGGFSVGSSMLWATLAEGHLHFGNLDEAREALEAAFKQLDRAGEFDEFWTADVYRLKGELLRVGGESPDVVEEWYRRALDKAREHGAKVLELRAAVSLARLWQEQNRISEALELVKPIFDSFDEGFQTPDLLDAKALLDDLA